MPAPCRTCTALDTALRHRLFRMRVAELRAARGVKRGLTGAAPPPTAKAPRVDGAGVGGDAPDESWSLLTVAPAAAPAISVAGAAAVFAAAAPPPPPAAADAAEAAGDGEDYLAGLNLDWRAKRSV